MSPDDPPGLDSTRLRAHLDRALPGLVTGPLRARIVEGGRSNLTYVVSDGRSRWVVRRPPLGHVLPTAHDMRREHRVISALGPTPVPVPGVRLLCTDESVLGAPFYVMDFVDGVPYRRAEELAPLGPERTGRVVAALIDTLVDLHAVDHAAVGLADFGRPDGFLHRQLHRWRKQLDASRSRDIPGIDSLHERLTACVPVSPEPAIVHGDYRLDNVLVGRDDTITAVLDWEMSTLGDPLTDLALLLVYGERRELHPGPVGDVSAAPGYPGTEEIATRYARRSGRDLSALNWYLAFAFFKLAVILEGIHYRFGQGQTVGAGFESVGAGVAPLVAHGNAVLKEG